MRPYFACVISLLFIHGCGKEHSLHKPLVLLIQHYKVPCMGDKPELCYLVSQADGSEEVVHGEIKGLHYELGYNYLIEVQQNSINDIHTNITFHEYEVSKLIDKQRVLPSQQFALPGQLNGVPLITQNEETYVYLDEVIVYPGTFSCDQLKKAHTIIFSHTNGPGAIVVKELR